MVVQVQPSMKSILYTTGHSMLHLIFPEDCPHSYMASIFAVQELVVTEELLYMTVSIPSHNTKLLLLLLLLGVQR